MVAAALLVLGLIAGGLSVALVRSRDTRVGDVGGVSGPLSVRAQSIYRLLSDADATAATAFLSDGIEPADLRTKYLADINGASTALAAALRDADPVAESRLRTLATQLPVYAGLVETARAYNRQGLPLGGAYLREASGFMRQQMLPTAQDLFKSETARLRDAQHDAGSFPWVLPLFGLALLGGLVTAQVLLTRRTNRMVNLGLATASLAAVVSLIWSSAALAGTAGDMDRGRTDSRRFELLAEARVAALRARADEALSLVARGDGATFDADYKAMIKQLTGRGGVLDQALVEADDPAQEETLDRIRNKVMEWDKAHQGIVTLTNQGKYDEAVEVATTARADNPTILFEQLDSMLADGISATSTDFDDGADEAAGSIRSAGAAIVLPGLVFLAGVVLGFRRRIGEYR